MGRRGARRWSSARLIDRRNEDWIEGAGILPVHLMRLELMGMESTGR